ncbi:atrial natriuretic peptide receptor 1-like isoform X2 [Biomphalaria glabrata]|nr:atrial natriuretic peptide receptor 1-like isoform X2 [Biomphalaria glabrata]
MVTYDLFNLNKNDDELLKKLIESSSNSRVYVLLMSLPDVRRCLLLAARLGMTSREYLYIVPDIEGSVSTNRSPWQFNETDDMAAKKAFQTVMFINIQRPVSSDFSDLLKRLNQQMYGSDVSKYVTSTYSDEEENVNQSSIMAQQHILSGYYNAFMIYLTAVNETLAEGKNISDGIRLVDRMGNRTYVGKTGVIQIDYEGNRVINFSFSDMIDEENGTFEDVVWYIDLTGQINTKLGYSQFWPAGEGYVKDIPDCGYLHELCQSDTSDTTVAVSCGIVACILAMSIGITVVLRIRYNTLKRDLYWWKINLDEMQPIKNNLTKSTFSSGFYHMSKLFAYNQSATNATESSVASNGIYLYKGNMVRLNPLCDTNIHVTQSLLTEFDQIRDINHSNLQRVLGAMLEGDRKMIVTEYCHKGTLQEILMDTKYTLDSVFIFSILSDIVKALTFLNKHPLRVHGRLTSDVCMIDSRFSVKIACYGLPTIYDHIKLQNKNQSLEKDLLWVAPELLRHGGNPTPQGDVYSLAIIMSEMLTRDEPYSNDKESLTLKELVEKIKSYQDPPYRPTVSTTPELMTMESLMRKCWDEDPEKRPSLHSIHSIINKLMVNVNKSGGLVDNLLQRLEKYSSNLEKIVDEKVDELRQEKQKSEELLKQMLPASVADRLKAGLTVEPEFYDCVTIYFSDIVGFTVICSQLTPVQIINLLNDLYSCFDEIIGNYDVYKVETIGDAYMVVSGLPTRNGNEHASQIAKMSLALLRSVSNFTIRELSKEKLKLRIGLNSGPVCAGVVGLKMPRYCLFGDAVNTASRMESNGVEFKIHMSSSTTSILTKFYKFVIESRGVVDIKGKGLMETFWLLGEDQQSENPV